MYVRQPEKALQWAACDSPVDRSWPKSEGLSIHENRKRKAQREYFVVVRRARPREPSHLVLVAGDSCVRSSKMLQLQQRHRGRNRGLSLVEPSR